MFHQAEINLKNNCPIRSRRRGLPSRWSKDWSLEKDENLLEQPLDEEKEIGVVGVVHVPWGGGRKNDRGGSGGS